MDKLIKNAFQTTNSIQEGFEFEEFNVMNFFAKYGVDKYTYSKRS
jgi:hypothetical protein